VVAGVSFTDNAFQFQVTKQFLFVNMRISKKHASQQFNESRGRRSSYNRLLP
jgi:hypothetical protein